MHHGLLNLRNPRTALCLGLVIVVHGLVVLTLQFQPHKVWPTRPPVVALPTISLRLLPMETDLVAAPALPATPSHAPSLKTKAPDTMATAEPAAQTALAVPLQPVEDASFTLPAPPLNLNLSRRDLEAATARKPPGELPTHMTPGAWQQFVKTLGPLDEIREERLSIDRVRIHTKYGCYELEKSATQRIDPYNWSPKFVTNCRYG